MLKPLSPKTLEKKYTELGLPKAKTDLLHTFFACCANLYGVISLRNAWDVFKNYEGTLIRRKDFVAFSGIVQREEGHSYSIYELKEIYSGEESDDPLDRIIVTKKLVLSGYNRFIFIYATAQRQYSKPYYLPDKQTFLSFAEDRFYLTESGKRMKKFIENLKTSGIGKDSGGNPKTNLLDLNGVSIKGKRLAEAVFITNDEQFEIDYAKASVKKQKLMDEFSIPASEKILNRIREYIMTGGVFQNESIGDELQLLVNILDKEYGVCLSMKQFEQFVQLFIQLNNNSNLWLNCGWIPGELSKAFLSRPT